MALSDSPHIIFTVNGPGEVSGWLYPLSHALKKLRPDVHITVCALPCVFSSGAEKQVIKNLGIADDIYEPTETLSLIFGRKRPTEFKRTNTGLVFHLGGESFLAWLLAKRLRYKSYAYVESPFFMQSAFEKIYFNGLNRLPEKFAREPSHHKGELMVDAALLRKQLSGVELDKDKVVVGLFPGSRTYIAKYILPFFAMVADEISDDFPHVEFKMAKADFVDLSFLRDFPSIEDGRPLQAQTLTFHESGDDKWIVTEKGSQISVTTNQEVLNQMDLALTIPGTNTGEMAALGIPMVLVMPTYYEETSPLPGPIGYIGNLPVIGKQLKRIAAKRFLRSLPLLAQPNRRSGRMIVPEIVGRVTVDQVRNALSDLLKSDNANMSAEIRKAMGEPGAAQRIADDISNFFKKEQARVVG
ncbi:MAG: hypothetical protein AAF478_07955 [Pseudomonadota bacterium]